MAWNDFYRFKGMRIQVGTFHVNGDEEVQESFEYAGNMLFCRLQKGDYPIYMVPTYLEGKKQFTNEMDDPVVYIPCEVISTNMSSYEIGEKYDYCYHVYDFQMIQKIEEGKATLFDNFEIKPYTFTAFDGKETTVKNIYMKPKYLMVADERVYGKE